MKTGARAAAVSTGEGDRRCTVELRLTDSEMELLRDTLESDLSDLLREIARTDKRDMREGLKAREDLLRGILMRIGGGQRRAA
jgi:hypothetical protein